jgi:hypothetical protein
MKTALQEIFEYWDTQNNPLTILNWITSNEKRLLEKEKESIIDAFIQGGEQWNSEDASEEYYNKNYNQNK